MKAGAVGVLRWGCDWGWGWGQGWDHGGDVSSLLDATPPPPQWKWAEGPQGGGHWRGGFREGDGGGGVGRGGWGGGA